MVDRRNVLSVDGEESHGWAGEDGPERGCALSAVDRGTGKPG